MRGKMVDDRLLQVWLPEIVNAQTAFRVVGVAPVLDVLVHRVSSPLPEGLICISAAVSVVDTVLNRLVSGASPAVDPPQMLISCQPGDRTSDQCKIFELWAFLEPR